MILSKAILIFSKNIESIHIAYQTIVNNSFKDLEKIGRTETGL
jgi:hypothetical protein